MSEATISWHAPRRVKLAIAALVLAVAAAVAGVAAHSTGTAHARAMVGAYDAHPDGVSWN